MPSTVLHKHQTKSTEKSLPTALMLFIPILVFALLFAFLYLRNKTRTQNSDPMTVQYGTTQSDEFEETIEFNGEEIPAPRM